MQIDIGWNDKQYSEISAILMEAEAKCKDLSPAWDSVREVITDAISENFQEEGRPEKWKSLTPKYRKRKIKQGYPDRILVRTGKMRQAATKRGAMGNIDRPDRTSFEWGIDLEEIPYARAQDLGYPPRNLPQREFMRVMSEDVDEILTNIHNVIWGFAAEFRRPKV